MSWPSEFATMFTSASAIESSAYARSSMSSPRTNPADTAATLRRSGDGVILRTACARATYPPVIAAVRVPPSAWITSQSTITLREPSALTSTTVRSGARFDARDVAHEALIRLAKSGLRIEALLARRADEIEEQLAEKFGIVHVDRQIDTRRHHPHARRAFLQPLGREQRGEILRHPTQHALLAVRALRSLGALLTLDALPLAEQVAALDRNAVEDVRMTAHELLAQALRDVRDIEGTLFVGELRVDRDLEQEITELVAQPFEIAGVERFQRLVRLFEQMGTQRSVRLLAVPGATVGRTKPFGDATDRRNGREIDVGIDRREDDEARVGRGERVERQGMLAGVAHCGQRMRGRVVLAQQREIGRRVEDEHDSAQRRKGMSIERARGDDLDAAGKTREELLERAWKISRRARALAPASVRRAPSSAAGANRCRRCPRSSSSDRRRARAPDPSRGSCTRPCSTDRCAGPSGVRHPARRSRSRGRSPSACRARTSRARRPCPSSRCPPRTASRWPRSPLPHRTPSGSPRPSSADPRTSGSRRQRSGTASRPGSTPRAPAAWATACSAPSRASCTPRAAARSARALGSRRSGSCTTPRASRSRSLRARASRAPGGW